jgi:phosphoinositide-3-kinase regulatory subunit 4
VPRNIFELTVSWAIQARESPFWRAAQAQRTFVFGSSLESIPRFNARDVQPEGAKIAKHQEDEKWVQKLRNLGLGSDEEWKIIALREYIYRMSRAKPRLAESTHSMLGSQIRLKSLEITPNTIFFDENESFFNAPAVSPTGSASSQRHHPGTIAEALMETSRASDKAQGKRPLRRVASDIRRQQRINGDGAGSGTTTPTVPHAQSDTDLTRLTVNTQAIPKLSVSGSSISSTSPTSSIGSGFRRKPSKNNLMNRDMGPSKASAETSTISATAFGQVEPPYGKDHTKIAAKMIADTKKDMPVYNYRAAHSYGWQNPTVSTVHER